MDLIGSSNWNLDGFSNCKVKPVCNKRQKDAFYIFMKGMARE
jgi:hypothetical protein